MHQHREEVGRLEELIKLHKVKYTEVCEKSDYANHEVTGLHRKLNEITLHNEQLLTDNNRLMRDNEALKQMLGERDREVEAFKDRVSLLERGH